MIIHCTCGIICVLFNFALFMLHVYSSTKFRTAAVRFLSHGNAREYFFHFSTSSSEEVHIHYFTESFIVPEISAHLTGQVSPYLR